MVHNSNSDMADFVECTHDDLLMWYSLIPFIICLPLYSIL